MMKYKYLLILLAIILSCNKEEERQMDYPLLKTIEITEISEKGAVFNAELFKGEYSQGYEYGFVWDTHTLPTIDKSEKYVIRGLIEKGVFSKKISTTLISDKVYYVRGFIQTDEFLSYGNEMVFKSKGSVAPQISDFYPKSANLNDTITIIGDNFSYDATKNKVKIGNFPAKVFSAGQDTLKVIIPEVLNISSSNISVSIFNQTVQSSDDFKLISPVISDFNEKTGSFGSEVVITGDHFLSNKESLHVYFSDVEAEITSVQDEKLVVIVPEDIDKRQSKISVEMNNLTAFSQEVFQLENLVLDSFSPEIVNTGASVVIKGNHFSPVTTNNIVTIGGLKAKVILASVSELKVEVPLQDAGIYPDRNVEVGVEVLSDSKVFSNKALINDAWFRIKDFPIANTQSANCFMVQGKAYVLLNNSNDFMSFNAQTHEWVKEPDFKGEARQEGAGFYLDGYIYFGSGLNAERQDLADFWRYDVSNKTWEQLGDIPFEKRHEAVGYSVGNKGYLSGGVRYAFASYPHPYEDTWAYNPETQSWTEVSSFGELEWGGVDGFASPGAVVINEKVYFGLGWNRIYTPRGSEERMFVFTPTNNYNWQQIRSFPDERDERPITFSLNGEPYFCTNSNFYRLVNGYYWSKVKTTILSDIREGIGFTTGGKSYVGLGRSSAMWEYDPSR